jgi:DivIVA domain-containing protein
MPSGERDLLPLGTGFDVVRRGYDRGQVEEHLDRVEADLRILTADRDAAVAQASELARALDRTRSHVEELRAQIDRLAAPPDSMEGLSERLQRMLRLAQDEAREMRSSAEQAARRTREEADDRARRTVEEADEHARRTVAEADQHAQRTVADADQHAQRTVAEADEQSRGTLDESHRQAREMHEAAEAEAVQVRTRYDSGVEDNERRRAEMEAEHHTLMETARAEAARIRSEAEAERRHQDEESRARRVQIEEDFEIAMASRRTESMRVLARSEADARSRAETQLRDAAQESDRRLREADAEVAETRRLRTRVTNQLATLRASLAELPGLDSFPEEARRAPTGPATRGTEPGGQYSDADHQQGGHQNGGHPDDGYDEADNASHGSYGARSTAATSS